MIRDDGLWTPDPTNRPLGVARESEKVTRHSEWTIQRDPGPDVVRASFILTCVSEDENEKPCHADSGSVQSDAAYGEWVRRHVWDNPGHRSYRLLAELPMVMVPKVEPL
ncbi:hypothetical protein ABZW30_29950 [Kitasatospora sp. NPDC004669]|uniref:DUF7848 domain-containing protein n=1 Tax=Kitasatospora sp. NPDC004669 TaxID=3154555 RepID=UPI0033B74161